MASCHLRTSASFCIPPFHHLSVSMNGLSGSRIAQVFSASMIALLGQRLRRCAFQCSTTSPVQYAQGPGQFSSFLINGEFQQSVVICIAEIPLALNYKMLDSCFIALTNYFMVFTILLVATVSCISFRLLSILTATLFRSPSIEPTRLWWSMFLTQTLTSSRWLSSSSPKDFAFS